MCSLAKRTIDAVKGRYANAWREAPHFGAYRHADQHFRRQISTDLLRRQQDACWTRIQARIGEIEKLLPAEFYDRFLALDDQAVEVRSARQVQKIDNGIEAQRQVLTVPAGEWARIHQVLLEKDLLTPKEAGVLKIAMQIPAKLPTEKQCVVLLGVLDRGRAEGICV